jgi:hypothetical protein
MIDDQLTAILQRYQTSFADKSYSEENDDLDLLMNVFGLTPELKRENRQYWGRELGMCWQLLVSEICRTYCEGFQSALKFDADEPCDLVVGKCAIDTKYRIGSGDSGTLKKFKQYGAFLTEKGYTPVFLILRKDNLSAAIGACNTGGWKVYTGEESYHFILEISGFDLKAYLIQKARAFPVTR